VVCFAFVRILAEVKIWLEKQQEISSPAHGKYAPATR